jgi:hypothetical protein
MRRTETTQQLGGRIGASLVPSRASDAVPGACTSVRPSLLVAAVVCVGIVAFALRIVLVDQQSAYMDEGTYILTGRILIEKGQMYSRALDWTYGSYLWSIIAGLAQTAGGIRLVRVIAALCGVVMTLATVATAFLVAPPRLSSALRWTGALIAGFVMAIAPTGVGLGRFGTYDAPAAAAFMSGVALLAFARRGDSRIPLLGAAALLFIAFLSKYIVAIYFPFICLYLLVAPRAVRPGIRNLLWFVLPLSVACAAYFVAFRVEMFNLLRYASSYTDLKSDQPLREYGWAHPEIWMLAAIAATGWSRASATGRGVALGGVAVILGAHAFARPDHDWWKHSIYVIFFLAPLVGLALTPVALFATRSVQAALGWRPATGTERVVAMGAALVLVVVGARALFSFGLDGRVLLVSLVAAPLAGLVVAPLADRLPVGGRDRWRRAVAVAMLASIALPVPLALSVGQSTTLVTFYPDLNPALPTIRARTEGARHILTDDSVLRYHLYPEFAPDTITDPFFITYRGASDMEGYRRSIVDRFWDVVVFDGGIGPLGGRMRPELGELLARYYRRTDEIHSRNGVLITIYVPREDDIEQDEPVAEGTRVYTFDAGTQGWGAHPDNRELQEGLATVLAPEPAFQGRPSLRFTTTPDASLLAMRVDAPVRRMRAQIYIAGDGAPEGEVRIGMVGFDEAWRWRDDGFAQSIPTGRWMTVLWDLANPGVYHEVGIKLPDGRSGLTVYLGKVEVTP